MTEKVIYMNRKTNAQVEVVEVETVVGGKVVHYKSVHGEYINQIGRHCFVRAFTKIKGLKI